jgi:hypothetical protein
MLVVITAKTTKRQFDAALKRLNKAMCKPVDIMPFIGTIQLLEDPVEYQRRIRDEWEAEPLPKPRRKEGKHVKKP